jgi:hypothetical protein
MAKQSYVKVTCSKCGRVYAVLKDATAPFPCPGRDCQGAITPQSAAKTATDAAAKTQG